MNKEEERSGRKKGVRRDLREMKVNLNGRGWRSNKRLLESSKCSYFPIRLPLRIIYSSLKYGLEKNSRERENNNSSGERRGVKERIVVMP